MRVCGGGGVSVGKYLLGTFKTVLLVLSANFSLRIILSYLLVCFFLLQLYDNCQKKLQKNPPDLQRKRQAIIIFIYYYCIFPLFEGHFGLAGSGFSGQGIRSKSGNTVSLCDSVPKPRLTKKTVLQIRDILVSHKEVTKQ